MSLEAGERLAYLTSIVTESDDAIYCQDAMGTITSWNPSAARLYGWPSADAIGRPVSMLVPEHGREHAAVLRERVLRSGHVERAEETHQRRDGQTFPVAVTVAPIRDDASAVTGLVTMARDLTEQRIAQETLARSEERLAEGEALAHVGSWLWDLASDTVQWSAELHRIHEIDPIDFAGTRQAHLTAVAADDRPDVAAALEAAAAGELVAVTHGIALPGGRQRTIATRAEAVRGDDGAIVAVRGTSQDITAHRVAEEAMRQAYERERAAAEELRAANTMKDDFLSVVSHELRTPLTSIVGFADLLVRSPATADPTDLLLRIRRNANEMASMIERLLDFSRLQAGAVRIHAERVEVLRVVRRCLVNLEGVVDAGSLGVEVPPGLTVMADPDALAHVLSNLLANAAHHAPGSPIQISAEAQGDEVVLSVADQGPGVPPELRERVFDRFVQATPGQSGRRGSGVGLSIVREYVQLQGGRVWCDAGAGGGARFTFTLPRPMEEP